MYNYTKNSKFIEKDYGYIYMFLNKINNKKYIGQSWNIHKRIREHILGNGYAKLLKSALNKYGLKNFDIKLLFKTKSANLLDQAEIIYIKLCNTTISNGYNIALGGSHGKHSDETKKLIGCYHIGKIVSEETRKKLSDKLIGKKKSKDIIQKMINTKLNKENKFYIFDCKTHQKIIEFNNLTDITKTIPYYRIYDSINNNCKIKYNNIYCYVKKIDKPNNIDYKFGRSVKIIDENNNIFYFDTITEATKQLNLKRGIIDSLVRNLVKQSKYTDVSGNIIKFTAKYE